MRNIPIYRAKSLKTEKYIEGFLKTCTNTGEALWIQTKDLIDYMIDENTLAIHFPMMLTINRDRIFASLQEDGKGGDITKTKDGYNIYERLHLFFADGTSGGKDISIIKSLLKRYNNVIDLEVIGIKENIK